MSEQASVFIADDDLEMRRLLASSFRRLGFVVSEAHDGQELLELLEKARVSGATPRLVVSDLHMPGASGLDVLHWLRRWLPGVPTIVISAFADAEMAQRAATLGASAVLHKPFDLAELEEQAELLANR